MISCSGLRLVTPAEAGVQMQFRIGALKLLDSGFHRNDRGPGVCFMIDSRAEALESVAEY